MSYNFKQLGEYLSPVLTDPQSRFCDHVRWHQTARPDGRLWFNASWLALQRGGGTCRKNDASLKDGRTLLKQVRQEISRWEAESAELCLDCLDRVNFDMATQRSVRTSDLREIKTAAPFGLVKDIVHELLTTPPAKPENAYRGPAALEFRGSVLCGSLRPPGYSVTLPVLFETLGELKGVAANLTLEHVPEGDGSFYPIPAFLFLERGKRSGDSWGFTDAEKAARMRFAEFWPSNADIRWRLTLRAAKGWPPQLLGDSLRGAFELGLARLLAMVNPQVKERFPNLAGFPLEGVAVSAGIPKQRKTEKEPTWGAVGGIVDLAKPGAVVSATAPTIHTLIVSEEQDLKPLIKDFNLGPTGIDHIWEYPAEHAFGSLHVIQAKDLDQAVQLLEKERESRWSRLVVNFPEPPPVAVERQQLLEEIEKKIATEKAPWIAVEGEMGVGKSTALRQLVERARRVGLPPVCYFVRSGGEQSRKPDEIARNLYLQLRVKHSFREPTDWTEQSPDNKRKLETLLKDLSAKILNESRRELIVIDGVDQIELEAGRAALDGVLDLDLPAHVRCVISLRRGHSGIDAEANRQRVDFEGMVNDREDGEMLLLNRGAKLSPPLEPALIKKIVVQDSPPTLFALDHRLRSLEQNSVDEEERSLCAELRKRPELWNVMPLELVRQELVRVMKHAAKKGIHPQRVLFVLGVHVFAGRSLKGVELDALHKAAGKKLGPDEKLWDDEGDNSSSIVLKRAVSFFKGDPLGNPNTVAFEFFHPSYREVIERARVKVERVGKQFRIAECELATEKEMERVTGKE